jgi:hypothetical protein
MEPSCKVVRPRTGLGAPTAAEVVVALPEIDAHAANPGPLAAGETNSAASEPQLEGASLPRTAGVPSTQITADCDVDAASVLVRGA